MLYEVITTRYYIDRLEWLAGFCRDSARDYYYFDSQLFQSAPQRLLSALSAWLELDIPLSERYQTFSQTGKARKGDSSKYIHSGKIGNDSSGYPNVHIPQTLLKEAQTVYLMCRRITSYNVCYTKLLRIISCRHIR